MLSNKKAFIGFALSFLTISSVANAENYSASSWVPESHVITQNFFTEFSKNVNEKTKGNINFEVYSAGALLPPKGTLDGVKSGIAQYGYIATAYQPALFPNANILNELAFVSKDPVAAAFASTEVSMLNPIIQKEYNGHDVVFGAGYSTMSYNFICSTPIRTIEDLKGKKIRTAGGAHVKWVSSLGAIPVSVSTSEMYSGLQRGSIDCSMADSTFLTSSFKLQEVAKFITNLNMGSHTSGGMILNKDFWKSRTVQERKILLDSLAESLANLEVNWEAEAQKAFIDAQKEGVEVIEASKEMKTVLDNFNKDYVANLAKNTSETRKATAPDQLIKEYLTVEEKWRKLLANIDRTDKAAVLGLLKSEIYNKISPNSYGL
ncbi:MAG: C4-dicarboxylate TRAP transporter substrate-binding protein [Methylocystaceae bacterium]|nr:C4-dicarboxylate TRAP transporter substrate-binding protein [Methylocystaceae bacterium]